MRSDIVTSVNAAEHLDAEIAELAVIVARTLVPTTSTARVQEMHMVIGHALCALLEKDASR